MVSFKIEGKDIKSIIDNILESQWGIDYKEKSFHIASPYGASFIVRPQKGEGSSLVLASRWQDIRMIGVKSGFIVSKVWPKIQSELVNALRQIKEQYELPDGMLKVVKNDEYCGLSIDIVMLKNSLMRFYYQGMIIRLSAIRFSENDIEVGFDIEEAPPILTKESDEDLPDEDLPDKEDCG
jgi:hypothetical protein